MFKKAATIFLLVFVVFTDNGSLLAQSNPILDSLDIQLKNTQLPGERIDILTEMGNHARLTVSLSKAMEYIDEAMRIAKELENKEWLADVSIEKGKIYAGEGRHDEAEQLFLEAWQVYKENGNNLKLVNVLNGLGIINRRQGEYLESVKYLEYATTYFSDSIDARSKGGILSNLSNSYSRINKFSLAYEKLFEGTKYYEESGFTRGIGLNYGNLGLLYKTQKDYDNAKIYYHKSLDILEKEGDLRGQANAYSNLANLHTLMEEQEKALEYHQKQLEIVRQMGSGERIFATQLSIISSYIDMGDYQKADMELLTLAPQKDQFSKRYQNTYHLNKAIIHQKKKQYQQGAKEAEIAYGLAKEMGDFESLASVLDQIQTIYKEMGNHQKAYEYLLEYKEVSDSINSEDNVQELTAQQMQFEFDKKQETYDLEKEALENRLASQTIIRRAVILVAVLVAIIALILYRAYRRKKLLLSENLENKRIIEEQSRQLRQFNEELEATVKKRTAELQQANYELRTMNYIASHDIKEPIRNLGNYAGLIFRKLPDDLKNSLGDYFDIIKRSTKQLYTLVEDFAKYTQLSQDDNSHTEAIDLNQIIINVEEGLEHAIKKYNGKVIKDQLPTLDSNSSLLYTTFQNLIENGLKYNQSEVPTVRITHEETEDNHQITITDNGIGIPYEYHSQIFEMFKRLHSRGVYEGSGIGLAIVKLAMNKLNGQLDIKSEVGIGSQFILSFPKNHDT